MSVEREQQDLGVAVDGHEDQKCPNGEAWCPGPVETDHSRDYPLPCWPCYAEVNDVGEALDEVTP